ncbi:MAG: hypothetical protein IH921_06475 [Gemmatimonadetes bacterium]|nr:hypothetical protein [Gemmatimonadota bacterium]
MREFIPLVLLFLFGGFAALSALLKSRAKVTAPLSVGLTVLEGISGMVLMGASLPMSGSLETASRVGIVVAVLVALSSTVHLMKVRERDRGREASEGKRLYAAVGYETGESPSVIGEELSGLDDSTHSGDASGRARDAGGRPGDALS